MKLITLRELESMLRKLRGTHMIGLIADTDPRLRTKGNPWCTREGRRSICHVRKLSHVCGVIGAQYASMVNRQRAREDGPDAEAFEAELRAWGERVRWTPLVEHVATGTTGSAVVYLEVKVQFAMALYIDARNGGEIPADQVTPWLPTRDESGRQELNKPIVLRDYPLDSIRELRMGGETFVIQSTARQIWSATMKAAA